MCCSDGLHSNVYYSEKHSMISQVSFFKSLQCTSLNSLVLPLQSQSTTVSAFSCYTYIGNTAYNYY